MPVSGLKRPVAPDLAPVLSDRLPQTDPRKATAFALLFAFAIACPVLPAMSYVATGLLFLAGLPMMMRYRGNGYRKAIFLLFAIASAVGILILVNAYFSAPFPVGERLIKYVLVVPVALLIVDNAYYAWRGTGERTSLMFIAVVVLTVASILLYYWLANGWDKLTFNFSDFFAVGKRKYVLFDTNANYRDDYFVYLMVLFSWCAAYLSAVRRVGWWWHLPTAIALAVSLNIVVATQSRGAWAGIFLALAYFGIVLIRRRLYVPLIVTAVVITLLFGLNAGTISKRLMLSETGSANVTSKMFSSSTQIDEIAAVEVTVAQMAGGGLLLPTLGHMECDGREIGTFAATGIFSVNSIGIRMALYANGPPIWWQRPLLGHGGYDGAWFVENYDLPYECVMSRGHLHNQFLEMMAYGGAALPAVFIAGIVVLFVALNRAGRGRFWLMTTVLQAYLIYQITQAMFDINLLRKEVLDASMLAYIVMVGHTLALIGHESQDTDRLRPAGG